MCRRATAALFVIGGLLTGPAIAQTPNPTQQLGPTAQQGPMPIFRVTVVGHTTPAINYRPRKGDTKVDFTGTALSPLAVGNATVGGKKGYIDIDAKFGDVEPLETVLDQLANVAAFSEREAGAAAGTSVGSD